MHKMNIVPNNVGGVQILLRTNMKVSASSAFDGVQQL